MIRLTISFIVIWLIIFTSMATFDFGEYWENWGRAYAFWDKGAFCLLCWIAWKPQPKKDIKELKPLFWLLICRLVWDGISWLTGLDINNTKAVGVLFLIYSFYVLYKALTHVRD